jgi:hypothetical protein
MIATLDKQIRDAGIPIYGVSAKAGVFTVQYKPNATAQNKIDGDAMAAAFDDTADNTGVDQRKAIIEALAAKIKSGTNLTLAEVSKVLLFLLRGA